MKKFLLSAVVLVSISTVGVTVASAAENHMGAEIVNEENVIKETEVKDNGKLRYDSTAQGGGWWRRGKNGNRNISEFKHYSKKGRASCENGNGTFSDGGWKNKEVFSNSSVGYTVFGGNKVYYDSKE